MQYKSFRQAYMEYEIQQKSNHKLSKISNYSAFQKTREYLKINFDMYGHTFKIPLNFNLREYLETTKTTKTIKAESPQIGIKDLAVLFGVSRQTFYEIMAYNHKLAELVKYKNNKNILKEIFAMYLETRDRCLKTQRKVISRAKLNLIIKKIDKYQSDYKSAINKL